MLHPLTISHSSSQNFEKVDFRPPWPDHRNSLISKSTKARGLIFLGFTTNNILNIYNFKQLSNLLYFSKRCLKYTFFSIFSCFLWLFGPHISSYLKQYISENHTEYRNQIFLQYLYSKLLSTTPQKKLLVQHTRKKHFFEYCKCYSSQSFKRKNILIIEMTSGDYPWQTNRELFSFWRVTLPQVKYICYNYN